MLDFDVVYEEHKNSVFRFVLSRVGRREVAEEITQDAFLALWKHIESVDAAQLPAWLITVARNRVIDYFRKLKNEELVPEPELQFNVQPRQGMTIPDWLSNPSLKRVHRVCLILKYGHGLTKKEIAQATGLSDIQVKGHLQYARQLLRVDEAATKRRSFPPVEMKSPEAFIPYLPRREGTKNTWNKVIWAQSKRLRRRHSHAKVAEEIEDSRGLDDSEMSEFATAESVGSRRFARSSHVGG